ncbi:uncharacterized protein IL334_001079 [Kwoniella shivajii]|uniref:Mannosyltransferase n=1 Tax=Kwoniella shivajii TaxID=564305 RepID=A0ABZ1CQY5_9TREE|nr:hypothetical protein IL334_001079 [Kwoniella shivajii]
MKTVSPGVFRRKLINAAPNVLPFIITFSHVCISPYTKVEESFTLHAVHDVLSYGFDESNLPHWDHITFPGAVPRSFLPPIVLGLISYPFSALGVSLGLIRTKLDVQILIRLILASIFSHTFNHLSKTVRTRFGSSVRIWFTLLSLTSFHIPYYASRTLPNFMALPGVLLSISLILRAGSKSAPKSVSARRQKTAVILLTALSTVIRLESALFLIPLSVSLVFTRRATLSQVVQWGMLGGFGSLAISSSIDYTLWKPTIPHKSLPTFTSTWQILWPELSALHYNFFQGQSSNWGIMPFHYYFTNSLPKILLTSLPLIVLSGLIWFSRLTGINTKIAGKEGEKVYEGVGEIIKLFGAGTVTLIGAMSLIGHKEWRFIIYSIPVFQLIASFSATFLWNLPNYPRLRSLFRFGLIGLVLVNVSVTGGLIFLSMNNYPGGQVWKILENLPDSKDRQITIHFPSYPLQTGSTLFTFLHQYQLNSTTHIGPYPPFPNQKEPKWIYSKSEEETFATPEGLWENNVDYVVTEEWDKYLGGIESGNEGRNSWKMVGEIEGLDGVSRGGKYGLKVNWARKLAILGR